MERSRYAAVEGVEPDGDGKLLLIEGFDPSQGDVLEFLNARNVNGDGRVETAEDLEALRPFFKGAIDADSDGAADDLHFDVNPAVRSPDGYDVALLDAARDGDALPA